MAKWSLTDRAQLHKDANKLLDENLAPGESVRAIIRGQYDSAAIATERRIFVFKKGWLSGAVMAKKMASWDYRNVTGIQVETGIMGGTFVVQAAGAQATDASYWGSGDNDAAKASNALGLYSTHFEQAREGAAVVRELIAAFHEGGAASPTPPPQPDVFEQIRKLGELRDAGVVTPAEFETKKAELLGRL
jgi:Short C-terminal domain